MSAKKKSCKLVRVIFRTFDKKIFTKRYNFLTSLNIWLTKIFTIPWFSDVEKYDHAEAMTPQKQRFSIRMEKEDPFGLNPTMGVYCLNRDGFDDNTKNYNFEKKEKRYKLIFAFEITNEQEKELYRFINKHSGEKYSLYNANVNVILNKLNEITCNLTSYFLIDEYNDNSKKEKKWDCVTLIMRALFEIGLIPEYRTPKPGKTKREKINLLGLSAYDMAQLLLGMYKNEELFQCKYIISKELQTEKEYKEGLKTFYDVGAKITRTSDIIID